MTEQLELKKQAGRAAADATVKSGMVVGLGTGTTATWALQQIGERLKTGHLTDIVGIPTSERTAQEAQALGVPLTTLKAHPVIDVTIDGADEVSPELNLIKGGGGALLREKVVAQASKRVVIVVDEGKMVHQLGASFQLPVEVIPFSATVIQHYLATLACTPSLRQAVDGTPYTTDNGNWILDCAFPNGIQDIHTLAARLCGRAGIVEHGLFIQLATEVIVAGASGITRIVNGA